MSRYAASNTPASHRRSTSLASAAKRKATAIGDTASPGTLPARPPGSAYNAASTKNPRAAASILPGSLASRLARQMTVSNRSRQPRDSSFVISTSCSESCIPGSSHGWATFVNSAAICTPIRGPRSDSQKPSSVSNARSSAVFLQLSDNGFNLMKTPRHSPGVCSSKASNPATHFFSSTFTGAAPAGGAALLGDAPSFDLFTTVEKYFFTTSWYSRGTWLFAIASVACC